MSFYVTATDTTITFHVTAVEGRSYYRLYWRLATETIATTKDFETTTDFEYIVEGLAPETEYATNVAHWETSPKTDGDNNYILMGAQSVTTDAAGSRPSDWSWSNIAKGSAVPKYGESLAPVSAAEWNAFCVRINEFLAYKGWTRYPFYTVAQGAEMNDTVLNMAIAAIETIPGHGTLPTEKDVLSADFWLGLAAALNAVE